MLYVSGSSLLELHHHQHGVVVLLQALGNGFQLARFESFDEFEGFELYLRPTFDFKQELLAQGREVEVLQPASLREEMKQMIRGMMGRYEDIISL